MTRTLTDTEKEIEKVSYCNIVYSTISTALYSIKIILVTISHRSTHTHIASQLTEHKDRAEKALEAKILPLDVVLECLSHREQRASIDLVRDDVEAELHKVNTCIL